MNTKNLIMKKSLVAFQAPVIYNLIRLGRAFTEL